LDTGELGNALDRFNNLSLDEMIALKKAGKRFRADETDSDDEDESAPKPASRVNCAKGEILKYGDSCEDAGLDYADEGACVAVGRRMRRRRKSKQLTRAVSLPSQGLDTGELGNALDRFNNLSLDEMIALKKAGKLRRSNKESDESEYEDVHDQESNDEDIDSGYNDMDVCDAAPMRPSLTEHDFQETVEGAISSETQTDTSALTERLKIALRSKLFPEDGNAIDSCEERFGQNLSAVTVSSETQTCLSNATDSVLDETLKIALKSKLAAGIGTELALNSYEERLRRKLAESTSNKPQA
jgi:hypothetical protein